MLLAAGAAVHVIGSAGAVVDDPVRALGGASHVVIPQVRGFAISERPGTVEVRAVAVRVDIRDRVARTTLDVEVENAGPRLDEAALLVPLPRGAVVSGFAFEGNADDATAVVMRDRAARDLYDAIVARVLDPALLEFAGHDLVRSSVFPIAPSGTRRVRIMYEHLLAGDGDRIDYVLPRSESLESHAAWTIDVDVRTEDPIAAVYSPTHHVDRDRVSPRHVAVRLDGAPAPGPFRLAILSARDRDDDDAGLAASVFAYPDPDGAGGYFLLMAGAARSSERSRPAIAREVTIVLDRSGSMAGHAMDQARAAALAFVNELEVGEAFNVVDYASSVSMFAPEPVTRRARSANAAREYLRSLRPSGGTNIHDALLEALGQPPTPSTLPIVVFLTDGLPTIGRTGERSIREMVASANPHGRRVFTVGVGADVNAPLLDRIAEVTRGSATYVPSADALDETLSRVFHRLHGPLLAGPTLDVLDSRGRASSSRVRQLEPSVLPDLFEDEQLIVLGRYRGRTPITFVLAGDTGDRRGDVRERRVTLDPDRATTRHAFVPRLWASRRIATLVDEIRQSGADDDRTRFAAVGRADDPRRREIVGEIVRLSTEFGILTEYTAFLATEGTVLGDPDALAASCERELDRRAVRERTGLGALSQAVNQGIRKRQAVLNPLNRFLDGTFDVVDFASVRQIGDRTFFRSNARWIDSRLLDPLVRALPEPHRVIAIGSDEHAELTRRLAAEGRQGVLSLPGQVLLSLDGLAVLVTKGC